MLSSSPSESDRFKIKTNLLAYFREASLDNNCSSASCCSLDCAFLASIKTKTRSDISIIRSDIFSVDKHLVSNPAFGELIKI